MTTKHKHPNSELLSKGLDQALDLKTQADLDEHLGDCPVCRGQSEGLNRLKMALQNLSALEERWVKEPAAPIFVPVHQPVRFPQWGVPVGALASMAIVSLLVLWPATPPMRIISTNSAVLTSDEGHSGSEIKPDTTFRTLPQGNLDVDVEIPNQLFLRLKPGTTVTWQQVNKPVLNRRAHVVVNLMRGEILARTQDGFWGSKLEVRTPTANAFVKGTAFSVNADPKLDATQLKVLAGSVFFSPNLGNRVGVEVNAGEFSQIQAQRLPQRPEDLSPSQRLEMLEAYRIGDDPLAALVLGAGPERVNEFFEPALLYLSDHDPRVHPFLKSTVEKVNQAILERDLAQHRKEVLILETVLKVLHDPELIIPLRLYVGACKVHQRDPIRAKDHFRWVVENYPKDSLASLSLAAIGVVDARYLRDSRLAVETFEHLVKTHPHSSEAVYAREFLSQTQP